jgi:hypothetical protein
MNPLTEDRERFMLDLDEDQVAALLNVLSGWAKIPTAAELEWLKSLRQLLTTWLGGDPMNGSESGTSPTD